ncbi:hypothetical protein LEP3755_35900 [Leptolyngbya sp. NIES-3755]|nr:hypothetical protein LEP3755_35900 [Leptolyngbya sp. NIES-3755]
MPKPGSAKDPSESEKGVELDLDAALQELETLATKPKKIAPDKIAQLGFERIEQALEQGYSYTDIAKVFVRHGVRVSAKNLKTEYEAIASNRSA